MLNENGLPEVNALNRLPVTVDFDCPVSAKEKWKPVKAAKVDDERTLNINTEIGEGFDGRGISANYVRGALRRMGEGDITVNINSSGGDFFTGVAIYSMLREHDGKVNTNVLGIAASAASLIAMASDELRVAKAGFLMIHNSWAIVLGNRHDMKMVADQLSKFDAAMVDVYSTRSGMDSKVISKYMDNETFFSGVEAVDNGLADAFLESDEVVEDSETEANAGLREFDLILARAGVSRSKRREMAKNLTDTPGAVGQALNTPGAIQDIVGTPGATENPAKVLADIENLTNMIRNGV